MISDSERREVARKLRGVTGKELRYVFLGEILNFAVGGRCLDDEGDIDEKLVLDRLADLIDRPTTTRHGRFKKRHGWEVPLCEVCGQAIGDTRWGYCPKCGAVIV